MNFGIGSWKTRTWDRVGAGVVDPEQYHSVPQRSAPPITRGTPPPGHPVTCTSVLPPTGHAVLTRLLLVSTFEPRDPFVVFIRELNPKTMKLEVFIRKITINSCQKPYSRQKVFSQTVKLSEMWPNCQKWVRNVTELSEMGPKWVRNRQHCQNCHRPAIWPTLIKCFW